MIRLHRRTAARAILVFRFLLGSMSIMFPRFTSRWLMLAPPEANPGTPYFLRLFGGRDLYLGIAALLSPEPTRTFAVASQAEQQSRTITPAPSEKTEAKAVAASVEAKPEAPAKRAPRKNGKTARSKTTS